MLLVAAFVGIVVFLLLFMVFREVLNYKERKDLTEKLLSRDINDYYGAQADKETKIIKAERDPYNIPI